MTPIHLIGEYYVADIPDPSNAIISGNVITWKKGEAQGRGLIVLPPGNWQLICTTKECTEEQAKAVVGSSEWFFPERHIRYIDYGHPYGVDNKQAWNIGFGGPYDSFCSLLACRDLNPETNYVIIKKVS